MGAPASTITASMPANAPASLSNKIFTLSIGSGTALIGQIVFAMVACRILSKHDYATYRQSFLVYDVVSPLLLLGLPSALYYFLPKDPTGQRGMVIDALSLLAVGAGIVASFLLMGGGAWLAIQFNNDDLRRTLPWVAAYPLAMMPAAILPAVLMHAGKSRLLAVATGCAGLAVPVAGLAAVLMTQGADAPILTRITVAMLFMPIACLLMFRYAQGAVRGPSWTSAASVLRYGVPLGLAGIFGTLTMQVHAVVVASLCTPAEFAVYINGAVEVPLIGIITGSITTVIFTEMTKATAKGDIVEVARLFREAASKSAMVLFPSFLFFMLYAEQFMVILYGQQYEESAVPFRLYLLTMPVRIVTYGAVLMAFGCTRFILVRSMIDLALSTILCFALVLWFGANAAALAMVITLYIWTVPVNILKIHGLLKSVGWRSVVPVWNLTRIAVFSVIAGIVPLWIGWLDVGIVVKMVLGAASFGATFLLLSKGMRQNEKGPASV